MKTIGLEKDTQLYYVDSDYVVMDVDHRPFLCKRTKGRPDQRKIKDILHTIRMKAANGSSTKDGVWCQPLMKGGDQL